MQMNFLSRVSRRGVCLVPVRAYPAIRPVFPAIEPPTEMILLGVRTSRTVQTGDYRKRIEGIVENNPRYRGFKAGSRTASIS